MRLRLANARATRGHRTICPGSSAKSLGASQTADSVQKQQASSNTSGMIPRPFHGQALAALGSSLGGSVADSKYRRFSAPFPVKTAVLSR